MEVDSEYAASQSSVTSGITRQTDDNSIELVNGNNQDDHNDGVQEITGERYEDIVF